MDGRVAADARAPADARVTASAPAPTGAWALDAFARFDPARVPSPCFVVDAASVRANLAVLERVGLEGGASVLSALKAFSFPALGPTVAEHLAGTCASGLHEALLGAREYVAEGRPNEVHVYSAGYTEADLAGVLGIAHHVVFNSFAQWRRFRPQCLAARETRPGLAFGLRVNPEHSEGAVPIYDPCAPGSRLGITAEAFRAALERDPDALDGITGLHFHTLCEQGLPPLERTLAAVEARFGAWLPAMDWLNLGGGHHVTAEGYDVDGLVRLLRGVADRLGLHPIVEPGEAVAIHSGALVAEVLDAPEAEVAAGAGADAFGQTILDTSATCHMPDTLEMPYRAAVRGARRPGESASHPHAHRLGGTTCLAGDVIGDYAFERPLAVGDRLLFEDMAHYTMVKTTTFNGVALPSIALWDSATDALRLVGRFGYEDFRSRLG